MFLRKITTIILSVASFLAASALPASYYASSSHLSVPGRWVKVKVTQTGVQSITHDQLRQWGFNNPEAVKVYGFSGVELASNTFSTDLPDDLPMAYSEHIGNSLFFYGEADYRVNITSDNTLATIRNYYATFTVYFLSDADIDAQYPAPRPYALKTVTRNTHKSFSYYEPENFTNIRAGIFFFSNPLATHPQEGVVSFDVVDNVGNGWINFAVAARSKVSIFGYLPSLHDGLQRVQSGLDKITNIQGITSDYDWALMKYNILPSPSYFQVAIDKSKPLGATFADPGKSDCVYFGLDYCALIYERHNRLGDNGQVNMQFLNFLPSENVALSEATSDTRVWDVTSPLHVTPLETEFYVPDAISSVAPAVSGNIHLVAFDPSATLISPEYLGEVNRNVDLHADAEDYDMVIITSSDLLEPARQIAQVHNREQGLRVKVVDQQDIYDEFSSGASSAIGYRRYLKMLYDRQNVKPKYLLLLGRGIYDNRHLIENDQNHLMTYQCEEDRLALKGWYRNITQCFSSDNYFGMLDDDFKPARIYAATTQLSVGRLPVIGAQQAYEALDKINRYFEENRNGLFASRAAILSDYGDENAHMDVAEESAALIEQNAPDITVIRIYNSLLERNRPLVDNRIRDLLARGVNYIGYSGHGSPNNLMSNTAISLQTINEYEYANHPVVFLATCTGLVSDQSTNSPGMTMIRNPKGPAVVVGANREVFLGYNRYIFNSFTNKYYLAKPGDCVGDVWREAFNAITRASSESVSVNTLCYNLAGDPALPVPNFEYGASFTSIGGHPASGQVNLQSLTPFTVEGLIVDSEGKPVNDFNGEAVLTLLDGAETRMSMAHEASGDESVPINLEDRTLAFTGLTVENGRWEATITAPMGLVIGSVNRLTLNAFDTSTGHRALGSSRNLSLSDPESLDVADNEGPRIEAIWLESADFNDGDRVPSETMLYAKIKPDPSGICITPSLVGGAPTLTIDNSTTVTRVGSSLQPTPDGGAFLAIPLHNLADGGHIATLDISDNAGNHSVRSVGFSVVNSDLSASLSILDHNDNVVAPDYPYIDFVLSTSGNAQPTRLIVEDAQGNSLLTVENPTFPYRWSLPSSLDGLFHAQVFLTSETRWTKSPQLDFMIIR